MSKAILFYGTVLFLSACAIRPAEAAPPAVAAPAPVVGRVITVTVIVTSTTQAAATATARPPGPPTNPVGLRLTQPIDGNTLDGLVVRVLHPGFNAADMSSLGFHAYARVSPGPIKDGNGITRVRFRITGPNGFEYEHTEFHAPYCLFEESSPSQCRMLRVGDLWWGTRQKIGPGAFVLLVEAQDGASLRWASGVDFKLK